MAAFPLSGLADLLHDLRHSLRVARRTPLLSAVIVGILAMTIGATAAIFSLFHVFFRDLPVRDPARLVQFTWRYPADPGPLNMFSLNDYVRDRDGSTAFADFMGTAPAFLQGDLLKPPHVDAIPGTITAEFVTGNYCSALGLQPAAGRLLTADDDRPGAPPVAIASWSYWQRTFGGRPLASHRTVQVAHTPVPIVGVTDPGFEGVIVGYQPDVWLPASLLPPAQVGVMLFARLKPGVSMAQAQSEFRVLDRERIEGLGAKDPAWLNVKTDVTSARSGLAVPLTDQFGRPVTALMVLVVTLLLLACANIGGLLLARGAARQREVAVRLALGASRGRLARQMLTEAGVFAIGGAAAGLPLAAWTAPLLLRTMIAGTSGLHGPAVVHAGIDCGVIAFTAFITAIAALAFGAAPAFGVRSTAPGVVLKSGASTQARRRWSTGDVLVVVQVVLSFALLNLLELFGGHLWQLRGPALGFQPQPVLILSVDTATGRAHEAVAPLDADALARLSGIPGVQAAAVSAVTPIAGGAASRFITVEGFEEPRSERRRAWLNWVSPGYFSTLGTPLVAGRDFQTSDVGGGRVVIINHTLANHYFSQGSPLGKRIALEGDEARPFEVVGVVADAKYIDVHQPAPATMYFDYAQVGGASQFSVRAASGPPSVTAAARRVLEDVFGRGRVTHVTTLAAQVDASIVPERLMASLASFFGGVGALLAAVGLYGLLAFIVARRTREIGVRMALGASTQSVIAAVMTKAMILVGSGVAVGVPLAIWSRHVAAAMIAQLTPDGWLPLAAAAVAMVVIGVLGATLPARHAARVDPLEALRTE